MNHNLKMPFWNTFEFFTDDEHCASLTPSFCPEIIALLRSQRIQTKKTIPMWLPSANRYGFDEHTHGLY